MSARVAKQGRIVNASLKQDESGSMSVVFGLTDGIPLGPFQESIDVEVKFGETILEVANFTVGGLIVEKT